VTDVVLIIKARTRGIGIHILDKVFGRGYQILKAERGVLAVVGF
jgi:hypothetical protein